MCALRLVTARERTQSELQLQREGKRRAGGRPESGEANSSKGFREAVANGHGGASAAINRGKQMVEAPHSHHFLAPSSLLVLFLFFFFHFLGEGEGGILWPGWSPWVTACMCAAAESILRASGSADGGMAEEVV